MTTRGRAHPTWLYARLLGGTWGSLPEPLRRIHSLDRGLTAHGRAKVERGEGLLSRVIGSLAGFPRASPDVELRLDLERDGDVETWRRSFGGHVLQTTQETGRERRLVERFGPAAFYMMLIWDGRRLNLRLKAWRLFGLRMPDWTEPVTDAWEGVVDGRFCFFVDIRHPWTGLIVRYQGWLESVIAMPAPTAD